MATGPCSGTTARALIPAWVIVGRRRRRRWRGRGGVRGSGGAGGAKLRVTAVRHLFVAQQMVAQVHRLVKLLATYDALVALRRWRALVNLHKMNLQRTFKILHSKRAKSGLYEYFSRFLQDVLFPNKTSFHLQFYEAVKLLPEQNQFMLSSTFFAVAASFANHQLRLTFMLCLYVNVLPQAGQGNVGR